MEVQKRRGSVLKTAGGVLRKSSQVLHTSRQGPWRVRKVQEEEENDLSRQEEELKKNLSPAEYRQFLKLSKRKQRQILKLGKTASWMRGTEADSAWEAWMKRDVPGKGSGQEAKKRETKKQKRALEYALQKESGGQRGGESWNGQVLIAAESERQTASVRDPGKVGKAKASQDWDLKTGAGAKEAEISNKAAVIEHVSGSGVTSAVKGGAGTSTVAGNGTITSSILVPVNKVGTRAAFYGSGGNSIQQAAATAGAVVTKAGIATAGATVGGAATAGKRTASLASAARRAAVRYRASLEAAMHKKNLETREQIQKHHSMTVLKERKKEKGKESSPAFASVPILAFLAPLVAALLLVACLVTLEKNQQGSQGQTGNEAIVAIARQEAAAADQNIGGFKYKEWYGLNENWCAMFVSWCANECGCIELGQMPMSASVDVMKGWYQQRGQYHTKESGYVPQAGDIIFFGNGRSHTGIVAGYDPSAGIVMTVEGNTGKSETDPYHLGSRVQEHTYPLTYTYIVGYGVPQYPQSVVEIPEPFGTEYSYMGWQTITSPSSKQYQLREEAGMNFDSNGFGKIGERFVVACTSTFGSVGDYVDWELSNGTVIKSVIGDIKNQSDEGCNQWGHKNGLCVLEFVVDKESWYGTDKYPTDFNTEWDARTIRAVKTGNYWQ